MTASLLMFLLGIFSLIGAINAVRPPLPGRHPLLRPKWLPAMLTSELVAFRTLVQALLVGVLAAAGALQRPSGLIGLGLLGAAWVIHGVIVARQLQARRAVTEALAAPSLGAAGGVVGIRHPRPTAWLFPNPYRIPPGVTRRETRSPLGFPVDVYTSAEPTNAVVIQVHGGGWRGGNPRQQARPLIHHLAERGWVVAVPTYPLVPEVQFPDPLIAVKAVIAWARAGGLTGAAPEFVAITGGSAGAHLAALAALTPGRRDWQPGFEDVDTSVDAAVTVYGIYDLLNRNRARDDWPVVRRLVGADPRTDPGAFRDASPLDHVVGSPPPFLVIHGTHDSLVPIAESRIFVEALRRAAGEVTSLEVPGATHAFDVIPSIRTLAVVDAVTSFLDRTAGRYRVQARPDASEADG